MVEQRTCFSRLGAKAVLLRNALIVARDVYPAAFIKTGSVAVVAYLIFTAFKLLQSHWRMMYTWGFPFDIDWLAWIALEVGVLIFSWVVFLVSYKKGDRGLRLLGRSIGLLLFPFVVAMLLLRVPILVSSSGMGYFTKLCLPYPPRFYIKLHFDPTEASAYVGESMTTIVNSFVKIACVQSGFILLMILPLLLANRSVQRQTQNH